jgi:hypothetical protein
MHAVARSHCILLDKDLRKLVLVDGLPKICCSKRSLAGFCDKKYPWYKSSHVS